MMKPFPLGPFALYFSLYAHIPINNADTNNKLKPRNSKPMFKATNKEYKMAVITPAHSKNLIK